MHSKLLVLVLCGSVFAQGAHAAGEITGELTVNDVTGKLTHVSVLQFDDEEGMADGPELRILMTDREMPPGLLGRTVMVGLDALAREGKFFGVLLRMDPKTEPREVYGTVYHAPSLRNRAGNRARRSWMKGVSGKLTFRPAYR